MKRLAGVLVFFLLPTGCASGVAPDISGAWLIEQDRRFDGPPQAPFQCTFKQQSEDLIVTCGGAMKGKVRGGKVTWGFEKTGIPPIVEDRLVLVYEGELDASGTMLRGSWHLYSGVLNERGTFTARKCTAPGD